MDISYIRECYRSLGTSDPCTCILYYVDIMQKESFMIKKLPHRVIVSLLSLITIQQSNSILGVHRDRLRPKGKCSKLDRDTISLCWP